MSASTAAGSAAAGATVRRDRWGIAHVDAPDAPTAFAAQGWVCADDRIWQMTYDRCRALGRWAEVAGAAAVADDAFVRRLGLADAARADADALDAATTQMLVAYSAGVNRWLDEHADDLPAEFAHHPAPPEPWEPWHCLAVYKVRHVFMGTLGRKLWRARMAVSAGADAVIALVGDQSAAAAIVPGAGTPPDLRAGAEQLRTDENLVGLLAAALAADRGFAAAAGTTSLDGGSNSWAIHGSRTAGGMPLLAGDPHRGLEFPNVYHQCHLRCDEFDAVGLAFAGVPALPHFGHNEHLAWCVTHGMADDTDAFVETAAALERVSWRAETIDVAGADPVEVRCGSTAHGPVVFGDADDGVALSVMWTGVFETDTTFDALAPMLRARSVGEMRDAVRPWVIPVNNLLLADRRGDIAYQMRGRLVERPPAARWTPVPADGSNSWAGRVPVPFDDLPAALNPAEGFIVTANNRTSDAGPYVSIDFAGPARRDRIVELLADLDAADVDDMAAVHADVTSLTAPKVIAVLIEHATHCRHPAAADVLAELRDWDCRVTAESTQASVYAVVRRRWAQRVASRLAAAGPVEYPTHSRPGVLDRGHHIVVGATTLLLDGTWSVLPGLRDGKEIFHEMSDCVDGAIEELSLRLGSDRAGWHWSRLHEMASAHPLGVAGLDPPTAGVAGDGDTVRSAGVALETGELAATGSVARYAFDLADWDRSGWVVPHGVSGVRHSGHDLDQREAWLAVELLPMLYSDAAVAAHTESVHRL